jgi:hypothetical protein
MNLTLSQCFVIVHDRDPSGNLVRIDQPPAAS